MIQRLAEEEWQNAPGGPMPQWEVDDEGLLRSALVQPYQTVGSRPLYPAVLPKAACLFRGLVKNHGLADGNKRMGVTAVGVFLLVNGYRWRFTPPELRDYALEVAGSHGNYPVRRIERWLRDRVELEPPSALAVRRRANLELYAEVDLVDHLVRTGGGEL